MSYYGTILMTRADVVLTRLPQIESIGFRHRRLRELGNGWQVLETAGWGDPPDLERAVGEAAERWRAPVLGAYVADICAQIHGAVAGLATWSGHLPDAGNVDCCGMLHQPDVPPGGTLDAVEAHLTGWAEAAGLTVSAARLSRALRYRHEWQDDTDGPYLLQFEQIFELVRAFGFPVLPTPRPYEFDPDDEPFAKVTSGLWGLASQARSAAVYREEGDRDDEPADWEAEAIALEMDVHASLYGGGHPIAELTERARWIRSAYEAARANTPPPPRTVLVGGTEVTNTQRVLHDLGPKMIADQVAFAREHGKPKPNGTGFTDYVSGPGAWPDLP